MCIVGYQDSSNSKSLKILTVLYISIEALGDSPLTSCLEEFLIFFVCAILMKLLSLQRVADRHYVKTKMNIISKHDFYYALDFLMWHFLFAPHNCLMTTMMLSYNCSLTVCSTYCVDDMTKNLKLWKLASNLCRT